MFAIGHTLKDP